MITFHDQHGHFQLPTGWHEVTTRQFCDLDRLQLATVEARASYFAARPIQVNGLVADVLAFLLSGPTTDVPRYVMPFDLGQETYLQVETIRALLTNRPLYECYCEVYATFMERRHKLIFSREFDQSRVALFAKKCAGYPAGSTYPVVAHCLAELARLDLKYARLAEPDTTEAGRRAREAGSDRLSIYSHLLVAKWYAQLYGITLDAAYQTSWETIAVHLLEARDQAEVADQLQKNSQHE